jgi:uncharacterized protein
MWTQHDMSAILGPNPYQNRNAIKSADQFYGRRRQLARVTRLILGHQSVSILGERRVGKSSVLNALMFEPFRLKLGLPEQLRFVPLDLQYISGGTEDDFLDYLLRRISKVLRLPPPEPGYGALAAVAEEAAAQGKCISILMDEFEALVYNKKITPGLFARLRAWVSYYQIPVVIASQEGSLEPVLRTDDVGSSFLNLFLPEYVGPLTSEEAQELIRTPATLAGMEFTDTEVNLALQLGGFHPMLLQIACYHIFDLKQAGKLTPQALETAFEYEAADHLTYLLERLPPAERESLRSWVLDGRTSDQRAEAELIRKGILISGDGPASEKGLRVFSRIVVRRIGEQEEARGRLRGLWNTLTR